MLETCKLRWVLCVKDIAFTFFFIYTEDFFIYFLLFNLELPNCLYGFHYWEVILICGNDFVSLELWAFLTRCSRTWKSSYNKVGFSKNLFFFFFFLVFGWIKPFIKPKHSQYNPPVNTGTPLQQGKLFLLTPAKSSNTRKEENNNQTNIQALITKTITVRNANSIF